MFGYLPLSLAVKADRQLSKNEEKKPTNFTLNIFCSGKNNQHCNNRRSFFSPAYL